jgi:transcriptional regulator with XRE-family HTH domain
MGNLWPERKLWPEQSRAARGLLDWTQEHLARSAGVSRSTVRDFEGHRHELHPSSEGLLVEALNKAGVLLLRAEGGGPGVRLRDSPPPDATTYRFAPRSRHDPRIHEPRRRFAAR